MQTIKSWHFSVGRWCIPWGGHTIGGNWEDVVIGIVVVIKEEVEVKVGAVGAVGIGDDFTDDVVVISSVVVVEPTVGAVPIWASISITTNHEINKNCKKPFIINSQPLIEN